ncbi:3-deoxy-D-manno-octulosonic acid transferase [Flocculibacter collagenilyticus]|uniref:3-deoxy-D-manno-octulosonic acid transferase n=1 Tax=Flocculibacter collagenilyticus TaxID=2744479 RepID=UPI0018F51941|nr:3-deoxy-D-manno-octulosonic acid transferase [Flocculibacter collagenilyticus]
MWTRLMYSMTFYASLPLIFLYFLWRGIKSPDYREGFSQRLGRYQPLNITKPVIHCHCASLGEVKAALPLIKQLLKSHSHYQMVVTTTTPTGAAELKKQLGNAIIHLYAPLDTLGASKRFCNAVKPTISLMVEVELWPNWLHTLKQHGAKLLLINGRLSLNSFNKYKKNKRLMLPVIRCFDRMMMQYPLDAKRYIALGADQDKVTVAGNIKFDLSVPAKQMRQGQVIKQTLKNRPVWIAASTHPNEHELALAIHKKVLKTLPKALLILTPRHPEQFTVARQHIEKSGFKYLQRSAMQPEVAEQIDETELSHQSVTEELSENQTATEGVLLDEHSDLATNGDDILPNTDEPTDEPLAEPSDQSINESEPVNIPITTNVLLGDTMGEMFTLMRCADVAFVGGSWAKKGGHNPLEPAALGVPVMMGPHIDNIKDIAKDLVQHKAMRQFANPEQAYQILMTWLQQPKKHRMSSQACINIMSASKGGLANNYHAVLAHLK